MMKETVLSRSIRLVFSGGMAVGLGLMAQNVFAQEAKDEANVQRVEITGSAIKRAQAEGALPVTVVTHEQIEKMGVTNVEQLLSAVTSNSVVGANTVAQGVGASTYGQSAASLRGLGQSKTLVLVNGRRLANYATDGTAVDINSIPIASVDKVEILLDGASAIYGSDAIGGVINFIMRNNFQGVELSGYTGGTKDGGGAINKAGLLWGFGDYEKDRFNLTLGLDVGKDSAIYGSQRSYAQNAWLNDGSYDGSATPSGAIRTFKPNTLVNSHGYVSNLLSQPDPAHPSNGSQGSGIGGSFGNPLNGMAGDGSDNNCAAAGAAWDAILGGCRYNPAPLVPLVPEVTRTNFSGSFRFKLSEDHELFAEGFYSKQKTVTSEQPSPYSVSFLAPDTEFVKQDVYPAILLNPTNPNYPAAFIAANGGDPTKPVTVSYRAFDGGGRIHTDNADHTHLVLGARGVVKGFDYDIAYNHNSSTVSETTQQGYQRQIELVKLLSGNDAFNPFAMHQSPALAAAIFATNYNGRMLDSTLTTDSLNAKLSGDLFKMPAGVAKFAVAATIMDEQLNYTPSAAFQSGDISGYGGQALTLQTSRNSSSVLGEVNLPLLKSLETDIAVRRDQYPNVSSTNPKISFRYQPVSQALVRASWGKGFREGSLPELYNPQTFGTTAFIKDPANGVSNQWNETLGGNPNLKPERSEQSSIGLVLDPVKGLSMSIDYWKINVRDLITTLGASAVIKGNYAGDPAYAGMVTRDGSGTITNIMNTNVNAGGVKVAGIDLDVRWQFLKSADYGTYTAHLNGTYLTKYDETLPDGSVQPSIGATYLPDDSETALTAVQNGGIIFRWRHQLTLDWQYKQFGLSLTQNYQSGYRDAPRADCSVCDITEQVRHGSFQTWDLQGTYTGIKNLTLRAGVKNLFNKLPPIDYNAGLYFQSGYDPTYYDAHGMFGYLTATYKF